MRDRSAPNPNRILSPGTQVVTRVAIPGRQGGPAHPEGTVGVVIQSPADHRHAYHVRLPDGTETTLRRDQIAVLRHFTLDRSAVEPLLAEYDLYEHVIYRCVVGSRAFGLAEDESDTDRRGIYLPPADAHWSLYGVPEQLEDSETDECYWELRKFLVLALKANPNILECLYTPLVELATPLARELLGMRDAFLSKFVYQTYNGYVLSQFKRLQQHVRNRGTIKWKHAMHLVRLLLSGISVLRDGTLTVRLEEHREKLLAIRRAEWAWEDVDAWRLRLHGAFERAYETTPLPERPDYARVNAFLIKARRSMVS